jgi:hypothetical protein
MIFFGFALFFRMEFWLGTCRPLWNFGLELGELPVKIYGIW